MAFPCNRARFLAWHSLQPNRFSGNAGSARGNGCANQPPARIYRPAPAVLIRKRIRGRVVNIWLVLIVVLGASIALADGLTRTPIAERVAEREGYWNGPLEYKPYLGAFLLAAITFPLMIAYTRKARVSLSEGLFLWLVFCTTAYSKDFSYLRWPGVPLFVTDVVLLILFLSIFVLPRPHYPRSPLAVNLFLFLFLAAGVLSAVRGFSEHRDPIFVLRDAALVEYSLFMLVAYHLVRSWLSVRRVAAFFLMGAAVEALNGLGWFFAAPGERRFVAPGIYILISLLGILFAILKRLIRRDVGWALATLLFVGLLLANARSLFVVLAILLLLTALGGRSIWGKIRFAHLVPTLLTGVVLVTLVAFFFLQTRGGHDFAARSTEELDSGILHSSQDPDWQFRLAAWREAWRRFAEYPLAGEGFGAPFTFEIWDGDPRPHNTFLTVLYKMGLIGFLPLLGLLAYFFSLGLSAARRNLENRRVSFLQLALLAQLSLCLFGTANLLLESPFLASLFWAAMGIGLRISQKLDFERRLQPCSQSMEVAKELPSGLGARTGRDFNEEVTPTKRGELWR